MNLITMPDGTLNTESTALLILGENATEEELAIKCDELLITHTAAQYQRDRAVAYPSLTEQADMAYWDRQNGTTTLDDAIMAVKAKHPKGVI